MVLLFSATLLLGSALLFLVEPMVAKMLLPKLGGAPAVWNSCVVFYQAALLGGYLYAHFVSARLHFLTQVALHGLLLTLAAFVLPIQLTSSPPPGASPVPWLLVQLLGSVGLPFLVLSANAPLLQRWFANSKATGAKDPFFLFAASNLGSFLGLVAYPFLVEPTLRLRLQSAGWSVAYALVGLLTVVSGTIACAKPDPTPNITEAGGRVQLRGPTWLARLRWVLLAFVPSTLMLSVTSYLTTDIAPVPLLWVIPLGLYLLSFVVTFGRGYTAASIWPPAAFVTLGLPTIVAITFRFSGPAATLVPLHTVTFALAALICHGQLSTSRPTSAHLTEFYLWVSLGGVAGGVFNTLLAPLLFVTTLEYPLALLVAFGLNAVRAKASPRLAPLICACGLLLTAVLFSPSALFPRDLNVLMFLAIPVGLLCFGSLGWRKPGYPVIAAATLLLLGTVLDTRSAGTAFRDRNFFGTREVRSTADGTITQLVHGSTVHGEQWRSESRRCVPVGYYDRTGPLGDIMGGLRPSAQVAILGLGAGGMASYARPDEAWTFYELDPGIEQIARNSKLFTFLQQCAPQATVTIADARLGLATAASDSYDLIALDVFSSDAIPLHLLTREALVLYRSKLKPGGIIAFHISNRYLDLAPEVRALADSVGLVAFVRADTHQHAWWPKGKRGSVWAVAARSAEHVRGVVSRAGWEEIRRGSGQAPWTDDFSNLFSAIRVPRIPPAGRE